MNCPNCGKKPTGLSYILTSNDFDLKTRMLGYVKCQHCGSLLGQEKRSLGIPKYRPIYYVYLVFGVVFIGVGSFYLFSLFDTYNVDPWIYFGTLGLIFLAIIVGITALANRYRILEEVNLEEIENEPKKLTAKGLAVFGAYFVTVLVLFWAMNKFVDMRELGFTLYLIIQNVYLGGVMFGAFYLFKKFEKDGNKSPQNEPAQS